MRFLLIILFIMGSLSASIFGVQSPPMWDYFIISISVAGVCVFIYRFSSRSIVSKQIKQSNREQIISTLTSIEPYLDKVLDKLGRQESNNSIKVEIENLQAVFEDIYHNKKTIIHTFSLSDYALLLSYLSSVERYINRGWSALVEGYVKESEQSLQTAKTLCKELMIFNKNP